MYALAKCNNQLPVSSLPLSLTPNFLKSQLSRLQQIQNSLARTVVNASKSCHITRILCSLHWLRITERIEYKLISLTYKVLTTLLCNARHILGDSPKS